MLATKKGDLLVYSPNPDLARPISKPFPHRIERHKPRGSLRRSPRWNSLREATSSVRIPFSQSQRSGSPPSSESRRRHSQLVTPSMRRIASPWSNSSSVSVLTQHPTRSAVPSIASGIDQQRTAASVPPTANRRPSGLNTSDWIALPWASTGPVDKPVSAHQSRTVPSCPPVASIAPLG